ncbi:MAG TPA: glycosyltransferase family 2 protein [Verrucomicrobia bacterium]|nr:glycosyltransferase family 2 protein [Verrucomicrobiota bacterium]
MKLVIQIPCLNEEQTLPQTLRDLPKSLPGIDEIEVLVVDDGSTDRTAEVARAAGARVLSLGTNRGLGRAFSHGLEAALAMGADIVVNTDADNQYVAADMAKLIQPILDGRADIVVGCRPIEDHPEFSAMKKLLQRLGSWVLRLISRTTVRDAASGYRAYSKEACRRLFVYTSFSYCMETLIQAGNTGMRVASVDIRVNPRTRPSRLFRSIPEYLWKSGSTIVSMFIHYRPSRFFGLLTVLCFAAAVILGARFIYLVYLVDDPASHRTHLPSLILLSILAINGVLFAALAVIAELMRAQRRLTEEALYQLRKAAAREPENPPKPEGLQSVTQGLVERD